MLDGVLPNVLQGEQCLIFQTKGNAVRVTVDAAILYQQGLDLLMRNATMLPNVYCIVPIPEGSENAEFSIEFLSIYDRVSVPEIYMAPESAAYYNIIGQNIFTVLFSAISFLLGVILIVFSLHSRISGKDGGQKRYALYWGIFSILLSIWAITDCMILQMVFHNGAFFLLLSFYSFLLLPIPFLLFVKDFCGFHGIIGQFYHWFAIVFALNFAIDNLLFLCNILDLRGTLPISHTLIVAAIFLIVGTLISQYVRTKKTTVKYMLIAFVIFALLCVLQFVTFYLRNGEGNNSYFLQIGMVICSLTLAAYVLHENSVLFEEATKLDIYKKLAMYDPLTQCENRAAMDYYIKESFPEDGKRRTIGFAVIDLNNLKETNDTYGHIEGDALITDTAACLQAAFDKTVKFYRTGGDEFYIIFNDISNMEPQIQRLYEIVESYNQCHAHKISFAMGSCVDDIQDYSDFRRIL